MNDLDKLFEVIKGLKKSKGSPQVGEKPSYQDTYLITGLGNPGREYQDTRHNIGFKLLDQIANELEVEFSRSQSKALVTTGFYHSNKLVLVKPQTYMNKSGHTVRSLLKFYKLEVDHLLVVYDDVDLPFGTVRIKPSGGSAGHKGMKSIIQQLGTQAFPRLRLGVGRPPGSRQAANYVLKPFGKEETEFLPGFLERAAEATLAFVSEGIEHAMTHHNRGE